MVVLINELKGFSFISQEKTRQDRIGAEVKVTLTSGIPEIDVKKGSENATVTIVPTGFKHGHKGSLSITDPVYPIFAEAAETETPILIRYEKRRKKDVDPSISIDELCKTQSDGLKNVFNVIAGVYDVNNNRWLLVKGASTQPSDDPEEVGIKISSLYGEEINAKEFFSTPAPASSSTPKVYPKKINNEDKANVLLNLYILVKECEIKYEYNLDEDKKRKLATKLLEMADEIQMRIYQLSEPDYTAYSHVKARYLLYSYVEKIDPLTRENLSNFKAWRDKVIEDSISLWTWALK